MNNLFLGIALLFLVMLVTGLVKPSILKMESRKRVAVVCGSMIVVFFVLFGITSPSKPAATVPVVAEATAAFDVPSLVGKNLDGIVQTLGTANKDNSELTAEQLKLSTEWSKSWEKNGQELLVTYNPKTKIVTDFFLPTTDSSGATTDTAALLKAGNLNKNDSAYEVEFVKSLKGGGYTGVKVTPR